MIDDGEVLGSVPALRNSQRSGVLRTQHGINPVFISVGHLIDLRAAQQIVLACAIRYRVIGSRNRPASPTNSSALRSGRPGDSSRQGYSCTERAIGLEADPAVRRCLQRRRAELRG